MGVLFVVGDFSHRQGLESPSQRGRCEVLRHHAQVVRAHQAGHLRRGSDGHGEASLDELKELVGEGVEVVKIGRFEQEEAQLIVARLFRNAFRRHRGPKANARAGAGERLQRSQVTCVLADQHQVEGKTLVEKVERPDHVLDLAGAESDAVMNHPDSPWRHGPGRRRPIAGRVHHHRRANAVAALKLFSDAGAYGHHTVGPGQILAANIVAARPDEQTPPPQVLEFPRREFVRIEQNPTPSA